MKVSIAFSGNGKKSLENALTVSIGFHCLFVNFLALISFMHNERELRTYVRDGSKVGTFRVRLNRREGRGEKMRVCYCSKATV